MSKHVAGKTYLTDVRSMFVKSRDLKFLRSLRPGAVPDVELTPMMQELTVEAVFEYDPLERHRSSLVFEIERNSFSFAQLQGISTRTHTLAGRPMKITNVEFYDTGRVHVRFEQAGNPLELFEGSVI